MIRSKNGIGSGDFLLLGGIGSILGASAIGPILLIGSSITLCLYAVNKDKELPLGFGLAIGAIFYCFLFLALYWIKTDNCELLINSPVLKVSWLKFSSRIFFPKTN